MDAGCSNTDSSSCQFSAGDAGGAYRDVSCSYVTIKQEPNFEIVEQETSEYREEEAIPPLFIPETRVSSADLIRRNEQLIQELVALKEKNSNTEEANLNLVEQYKKLEEQLTGTLFQQQKDARKIKSYKKREAEGKLKFRQVRDDLRDSRREVKFEKKQKLIFQQERDRITRSSEKLLAIVELAIERKREKDLPETLDSIAKRLEETLQQWVEDYAIVESHYYKAKEQVDNCRRLHGGVPVIPSSFKKREEPRKLSLFSVSPLASPLRLSKVPAAPKLRPSDGGSKATEIERDIQHSLLHSTSSKEPNGLDDDERRDQLSVVTLPVPSPPSRRSSNSTGGDLDLRAEAVSAEDSVFVHNVNCLNVKNVVQVSVSLPSISPAAPAPHGHPVEATPKNCFSSNASSSKNVPSLLTHTSTEKISRTLPEKVREEHGFDKSKKGFGFFCVCGKQKADKTALQRHIEYYDKPWIFECIVCDKKFPFASHLKKHKDVTHGVQSNFSAGCRECGATFQNMLQLLEHQKNSHARGFKSRKTTTKPSKPATKTKQKMDPPKAKKHATVLGASLTCKCGKTFSDKKLLLSHIGKQSGAKAKMIFRCEKCSKRFNEFIYLKKHAQASHNSNFSASACGCFTCGKIFMFPEDLQKHASTHSKKKINKFSAEKCVTSKIEKPASKF